MSTQDSVLLHDPTLHMNTTLSSSAPKRPIEWRKAFSAMRRLIKDPNATEEVFTIIEALSGDSLHWGFVAL